MESVSEYYSDINFFHRVIQNQLSHKIERQMLKSGPQLCVQAALLMRASVFTLARVADLGRCCETVNLSCAQISAEQRILAITSSSSRCLPNRWT